MACYQLALEANPDPFLHYEHASVAHALGDSQRLELSLRAALRLAPSFAEAYFELGNTLYSSTRHAESIEAFRFALKHNGLPTRCADGAQ